MYSGAIKYNVEDLEKLDSIAEGIDRYQEEGRLIKDSELTNHKLIDAPAPAQNLL